MDHKNVKLFITILLTFQSGTSVSFDFRTCTYTNTCSLTTTHLPRSIKPLFLSSIDFFSTFDYSIPDQYKDYNYTQICKIDCPPNCCDIPACEYHLNSIGHRIKPNTPYFFIYGGMTQYREDYIHCLISNECDNFASSSIYNIDAVTGDIDYISAEGALPLYLHSLAVYKINDNDPISIFIFGGKGSKCNISDNCARMWKITIPDAPVAYQSESVAFTSVGNPNPELASLMGGGMVFDPEKNAVLLFGGALVKDDQLEFNNNLWIFRVDIGDWQSIQYMATTTVTYVTETGEIITYNRDIETPKPRFLPNLKLYNNTLMVAGGFEFDKTRNTFTYIQDVWSLNLYNLKWTNLTPVQFFYNEKMDMTIFDTFSHWGVVNGDLTYAVIEGIADFRIITQDHLAASFAIYKNKAYILYWDDQYYINDTQKTLQNGCGYQNTDYFGRILEPLELACNLNGRCINGICICDKGYFGVYCEYKNCVNNCMNNTDNGNVESDNVNQCLVTFPQSYCSCDLSLNYGGDDCSMKFCINDCSYNGICDYNTGLCICKAPFEGKDCSVLNIRLD